MSDNKYHRLVELLIKKTQAKSAGWEPTSRDNVFAVSFPNYSVRIYSEPRDMDIEDVIFELVNSNGQVIDKFSDVEAAEGLEDKSAFFKECANLYESARRQALGVEDALDNLIAELNKE